MGEPTTAEIPALVQAAKLLFADAMRPTTAFFLAVTPDGLKDAFRGMARRCHPDLAAQLGVPAEILQARFTAVRGAYELLLPYVSGKARFPFAPAPKAAAPRPAKPAASPAAQAAPKAAPAPKPRPAPHLVRERPGDAREAVRPAPNEARPEGATENPGAAAATPRPRPTLVRTFYRGRMPDRVLRFGEFLYYSKLVSWEDLNAAITWQRRERPRLRDIALERGFLRANDLVRLEHRQLPGEKLWETALRLQVLDRGQLRLLVRYQRLQGQPLGCYFTARHLLLPSQVDTLLKLHRRHNLLHAPRLAAV